MVLNEVGEAYLPQKPIIPNSRESAEVKAIQQSPIDGNGIHTELGVLF